MRNQLLHVARTYWQRPVVIVLTIGLGIILLAMFSPMVSDRNEQVAPDFPKPGRIKTFSTTESGLIKVQSEEVTWDDLIHQAAKPDIGTLFAFKLHETQTWRDFSALDNIQSVHYGGYLNEADIDQLGELNSLKHLSVSEFVDKPLPVGVFSKFGSRIETLETTSTTLLHHQDELPDLVQLKLLILEEAELTPELIQQVTRIPNLQSLVLESTPVSLTAEELKPLSEHPTLRAVYAHWDFAFEQQGLSNKALLPVKPLPYSYPMGRLIALQLGQLASLVIFLVLALQLGVQFAIPQSRLIPNFTRAHSSCAVWIFVVAELFVFLALLRWEIPALPAMGLLLLIPALTSLIVLMSWTRWKGLFITSLILFGVLISQIFAGSWLLIEYVPEFALWFLQGNFEAMSTLLIITELGLIGMCLRSLKLLSPHLNESFASLPSFDFSFNTDRVWVKADQNPVSEATFRSFDKMTENLPSFSGSFGDRIQLWRRGNAYRPGLFMLVMLPLMTGTMVFMEFLMHGGVIPSWRDLVQRSVTFGGTQMIAMGLFLPAMTWVVRKKTMETDSLRPVTRRDFGRQLICAFAIDHWLAWGAAICAVAFVYIFPPDIDPVLFNVMIPGVLAALIWTFAASLSVLAAKRAWVSLAVGIALLFIPFVALMTLALIVDASGISDEQGVQILFVLSIAAIIMGIVLVKHFSSRILNREWG